MFIFRLLVMLPSVAFAQPKPPDSNPNATTSNTSSHQQYYTAVLVPAGQFAMGCTYRDNECDALESPVHNVTIGRAFYIMKSEVTQQLYESVTGENNSVYRGKNRPVEEVSWFDAVRFANKLSTLDGLSLCYEIEGGEEPTVTWPDKKCNGWRLPTEAEWEYAARGGQRYKYSGSHHVNEVAWYEYDEKELSGSKKIEGTGEVCVKKSNAYGVCDMSGNVWEWVWDGWQPYRSENQVDPTGPNNSEDRVYRGGSWNYAPWFSRVSARQHYSPGVRYRAIGFRLVRSAE